MIEEQQRLKELEGWHIQEELNFDKRLIRFRYETIQPKLVGSRGLELGPAAGSMTKFLVNDFEELTIVEGSKSLLNEIPDYPNIQKVHSLFEKFKPRGVYDSIIMEHILEHVENPVELLKLAKSWLSPKGRLFAGVPNGNSIHRLAGVKMGLLSHQCELGDRDQSLGHRRVYTKETFYWTEEMITGFFEVGKDFPELAAEIYCICGQTKEE